MDINHIKKIVCFWTIMIAVTAYCRSQSIYPGMFKDRMSVDVVSTPVESFELSDVRLLPGRFRENMQRDSAWLMSIPVERLLHSFFNNSGVWGGREGGYMTVKKLGGWESLDCELRGHTTGHIMSALALIYAATGHEEFKIKSDSIIDGLEAVQKAFGNGYISAFPEELVNRNIRGESVWAPWYTLHKILAGLIDQYLYANNPKALDLARGMADWAALKLAEIDEQTRAGMLRNEFGGINESFYNLYALAADEKYMNLAHFFYHNEVIDPLKTRNNEFGTKHTNTFIPKVLGEIRNFELTGDTDSRDLSEFFWDEMTKKHIFSAGCLSDKEHFFPLEHYNEHISGYDGETCCTYNMLKLGKHLFSIYPRAEIFDYYERALYNHILGQQNPRTGMVAYFLPLATGTHKVYSTPWDSFWCCVGSGFESHAKYAESIYFKSADDNELYVNLFIPSELTWNDKGFKLRQETNFPASSITSFTVLEASSEPVVLNVRFPHWTDDVKLKVNGKNQTVKKTDAGYIALNRKWRKGDKIDIMFNTGLRMEKTPDGSLSSLFYGPILLAGKLGKEGMKAPAPTSNPQLYNDYYTYDYNIPEDIEAKLDFTTLRSVGPLTWVTIEGVVLQPLYDVHGERHQIYWRE